MIAVISPTILFHLLAKFVRYHFDKFPETKKKLANKVEVSSVGKF